MSFVTNCHGSPKKCIRAAIYWENGGTQTAQTSASGQFEFTNLLPGDDYSVSVEAQNFKNMSLTAVRVSVNQTTDLPVQLAPGLVTETVTVTAGGVELVDTTSANLSKPSAADK